MIAIEDFQGTRVFLTVVKPRHIFHHLPTLPTANWLPLVFDTPSQNRSAKVTHYRLTKTSRLQPLPSIMGSSAKSLRTVICLLRNDLRIHDNEALLWAHRNADHVVPLYCFDPDHFKVKYTLKFI